MDLSTFMIFILFAALLSAKHFADSSPLKRFHYLFACLFRGGFAGAVGIWTSLILCWYFGLPIKTGFGYGIVFLFIGMIHSSACIAIRFINYTFKTFFPDDNNRLKF